MSQILTLTADLVINVLFSHSWKLFAPVYLPGLDPDLDSDKIKNRIWIRPEQEQHGPDPEQHGL